MHVKPPHLMSVIFYLSMDKRTYSLDHFTRLMERISMGSSMGKDPSSVGEFLIPECICNVKLGAISALQQQFQSHRR